MQRTEGGREVHLDHRRCDEHLYNGSVECCPRRASDHCRLSTLPGHHGNSEKMPEQEERENAVS